MLGIPFYTRFSAYYFLYYALLGVLVPYWALFLQQRGFSAVQIGLLLAIPHITKLGAPNLWGWLADKTGKRLRIIRMGNLCAALVFPAVLISHSFAAMAFVLAGFSFFWNAVMAQCEALVLQALGPQSHKYSLVRMWGSVGFVLTVLGLGVAVELYGVHIIALAMGLLLLGLWLASLCLPSVEGAPLGAQTAGQPLSFWPLFRRPAVLAFFVAGLLMQLSHGPYYAFYTLHLHALTVPGHWIGALWSVGVVAEILLFMCMAWLLRRFHIKQLLVASLLLAALRWAIIGSATTNWPWLVFAQCLHAASFACYHASAMAWLHEYFPAQLAGQAQAAYASVSLGAGWAAGAVLSGILWEGWGVVIFTMAAAVAFIAAMVLLRWLPRMASSS